MALTYTVKVGTGPGTQGYEHMTEKQRAAMRPWATFVLPSDAFAFEAATRLAHPTWTVKTVRREYGKDVSARA